MPLVVVDEPKKKKSKSPHKDPSSKIGESRSHMPKEQDGKTQQQKKIGI
jgi:hypothetical protein